MSFYDYSLLLGRMREQGKTQADVAKAAGLSVPTLNLKLNNKRDFKQAEIKSICNFLGITNVNAYFFSAKT